jgi:type II secretory pathway component GspD/PulD (secretin)
VRDARTPACPQHRDGRQDDGHDSGGQRDPAGRSRTAGTVRVTSPAPLPAEVRAFLDAQIFSVGQLEVLLLVHEAGGASLAVEEIARLSYIPAKSILPWLEALASRGILEATPDGFRFQPADAEIREAVSAVADCYAKRRVSVTRHVHASKEDPVQRFADAFRFRKDKDQ